MTDQTFNAPHERACLLSDPLLRHRLRLFYEGHYLNHNPEVDLRKSYSSQLPEAEQQQLLKRNPIAYFDGLPDFVQQFVGVTMKDTLRARRDLEERAPALAEAYTQWSVHHRKQWGITSFVPFNSDPLVRVIYPTSGPRTR